MTTILSWALAGALLALTLLVLYQWALAVASMLPSPPRAREGAEPRRFVVLIPAHDEEAGLGATLRSLDLLAYLPHLVRVVVVADRCADATAAVARDGGAECLERRDGPPGKGAAIAWAIDRLRESGAGFDALVVLDADTLVDPRLLQALDEGLRAGHDVQQAYNYLSNPWESAFTRVIAVTSILRNGLFYAGKERLGLAAMLTGTGMCFSRALLERRRWSAFSVGEDWEFSVALLLAGETIHFNRRARVLARESHDFQQASSQRMRWAGGRHAVASTGGRELLARGLRQRRLVLCDASLNVLAPTYSVQAVLSLLCLAASALVSGRPEWHFLFAWALAQTGLLAAYFLLGVALTAAPLRALAGILLIPAFLPWRMAIEIRGMLGQGRKHWVRTSRAPASR